jgi:hypothetical protein
MIIKNQLTQAGKNLIQAIKHLEDKSVKVGWFEKSEYANGTKVALVAAQNEYGNPRKRIPARPFMRPTVMEYQNQWKKLVEDGSKKVIKGSLNLNQVLDLLGFSAESDIKKTIKKIYYPALAEKTVLNRINRNKNLSSKKGRLSEQNIGNVTKPLIDTGIMFNTITHEVSNE